MVEFLLPWDKRKDGSALGVILWSYPSSIMECFVLQNSQQCHPNQHYTSHLIYSLGAYYINEHVLNLSDFLMEIVNSIIIIIYLSLLFLSA